MDNVEFIIDSLIDWEIGDWKRRNYIDVEDLTKPLFWRRLMNCRVDNKILIGGIITISEIVLASSRRETITAFIVDKRDTAEIILVYRDSSDFPWAMLRAVVTFKFHTSGFYAGMKKSMKIKVTYGEDSTRFANLRKDNGGDVLKKAVNNVMKSENFGLTSIKF